MSLLGEIKRRKIVQVAAVYAVVAWLLIQIIVSIEEPLSLPDWMDTFVIVCLAIGFPITLVMSWAFNLTTDGVVRDVGQVSATVRRRGRIELALLGLIVIAAGWIGYRELGLFGPSAPRILPNSVAVLPLENLSPDPDNDYYADGMQVEIINQLTKIRSLTVINRNSVLQYAENRPSIDEIAAALGVQSALIGTFQYSNGEIRVVVQLVDPTSGQSMWTAEYQNDFANVFAVQTDIAINVARALEAAFSDEEQARIERQPTDSRVAYGLLLRAESLDSVGGQGPRMHELLDQAIEIDPNFSRALGRKAWLYSQELINTSDTAAGSRAELEPLIRDYAGRALALSPDERTALYALGNLYNYSWRWSEAQLAYDRLIELSEPSTGAANWFWMWYDDRDKALSLAERIVSLDPNSWDAHWNHGMVLNYAAQYEAAAVKFRDGIAIAPDLSLQHSWLAFAEIALGNVQSARQELQLAERLLGQNRVAISLVDAAYGYGRIGDHQDASRLFEEITALAENDGQEIGAGGWALANLAIGNDRDALEWLERAVDSASAHQFDAGYYTLMNIRMNVTADPLLDRADFARLRDRLRGD